MHKPLPIEAYGLGHRRADRHCLKSSVRSAKSRSLLSKSATGRSAGVCAKRHRSHDFDISKLLAGY